MKKLFLFLYSTFYLLHSTFAQTDSVRITHTQETGTLEKQRFIDRYDYVFMTKEPTKWMLKLYGNINDLRVPNVFDNRYLKRNLDLRIGVEYKITPSFSIALDVARNTVAPFGNEQPNYSLYYPTGNKRPVTSTEIRWYYDMAARIKQSKSSNNFSGNYFSIRYEKAWNNEQYLIGNYTVNHQKDYTESFYKHYNSQLSLRYGMQRRFFRHGLIDFSVALNYGNNRQTKHTISFLDGNNTNLNPENIKQTRTSTPDNSWSISTNLKVGLALADFKKPTKIPACDVFQCFENDHQLVKIEWPRIKISTSLQSLESGIGYEQKIARSTFSINSYLNFNVSNHILKNTNMVDPATGNLFATDSRRINLSGVFYLQPRWYFLMKKQRLSGKAGNNLAGMYAGVNNIFYSSYGALKNNVYELKNEIKPTHTNTGIMLGYQRKIFQNGFIDLNISKGLLNRYPYVIGKRNFIFDFKLGFAL